EAGLFRLLSLSQQLAADTGGAFDITTGALIKAWGFFRRAGRVPSAEELQGVRGKIGMRHLRLDQQAKTVALGRPGVEINLASIGKGYALDMVAAELRAGGVAAALIHGGHSSVLALGGDPGASRGWPVGLLDPDEPRRRLAVLRLLDR